MSTLKDTAARFGSLSHVARKHGQSAEGQECPGSSSQSVHCGLGRCLELDNDRQSSSASDPSRCLRPEHTYGSLHYAFGQNENSSKEASSDAGGQSRRDFQQRTVKKALWAFRRAILQCG